MDTDNLITCSLGTNSTRAVNILDVRSNEFKSLQAVRSLASDSYNPGKVGTTTRRYAEASDLHVWLYDGAAEGLEGLRGTG